MHGSRIKKTDSETKDELDVVQVLSADLAAIYDCIFANEPLLDKLFAFVESDAPLNTLLAGYFSKIVSTLLSRRPDETLKVFENRNLVPHLLKHLGSYSILELLLKLIAEVEEKDSDGGAQTEWLHSQDIVGKLISKLDPAEDGEVHANVAIALTGFVSPQQQMHWTASLPSGPSRFTTSLLKEENVSALLEQLLKGSLSTLDNGLTVLVELVRHSTNESRGDENKMTMVMVQLLIRMGDLVEVLRNPSAAPAIVNTTGKLDPPLGQNRLKILEVIYSLISLKNEEVDAKMIELGVLPTVLDLFFKYEWHNFLHNLVKNLFEVIITGGSRAIKEAIFIDGKILTRIIDAHKANDEALKQPKSCRRGYMGQLRLISNLIQAQVTGSSSDEWMRVYTDSEEWVAFCDTYLAEQNMIHDGRQLGHSQPNGFGPQSDGEEEDNLAIPLDSNFEFRSPDMPDELFGSAGNDFDPDDDVEGNDMELDANTDDSIEEDVELAQLARGVNALSVAVEDGADFQAPTAGSPIRGEDEDVQSRQDGVPVSPEYNDVNFWAPSINWFDSK